MLVMAMHLWTVAERSLDGRVVYPFSPKNFPSESSVLEEN